MSSPLILALIKVFDIVIGAYFWVVVMAVVVSWLLTFGVLNLRNDLARQLVNILDRLTDPVFRQIRKIIPPIAGLDLSALIVLIALQVIQTLVDGYLVQLYMWSLR
jgi:YggT family protein